MKPLFLSIEGLQSFQEKQTIDFEKIGRDGLFGIFGPTGSGKSTIIDGMTLALYGSIIRFKNNKDTGTKDFFDAEAINKNSSSACVNFKFKVGENVYRAERTYKIGKKSGKISKSAVLFKIENGEEIKIAENYKEIYQEVKENILGLTLEDFTRSVVLPQGNFSQFLKLDGKEKRDMLERIFNLEKYGEILSKKANSCKYALETQIKELDIELSSIGFNEEELTTKKDELEKSEKELAILQEQEKEIKIQLAEMEEIEKLEIKLADFNNQKNELDSKKDYIKSLEEKTAVSEKFIPVIEKIHRKNDYEEKLQNLDDEISKDKNLFQEGKEKLERVKNKYDELERAESEKEQEKEENYISQEEFSKISDDYRNAVKKEELLNKKSLLEKELDVLKIETEKISADLKRAEEEKTSLEKELSQTENISQNDIFALEKEILEKSNVLKSLTDKEKEILKQEERKEYIIDEIEVKSEELIKLQEIEKEFLEQREKFFIYELRKKLHSGEKCPVCNEIFKHDEKDIENEEVGFSGEVFERIERDIYFKNSNILTAKERLKETEEKISALKEEIKNISLIRDEIKNLKTEKDILKNRFDETEEKKKKLENELKNSVSKINSLQLSFGKYENQISLKNNHLEEIITEISLLPDISFSIEELTKTLNLMKTKNALYTKLETELSQIRKEKKDIYENKIVVWSEKVREFEKALIQKEENYRNLKHEHKNLSNEIDKVLLENKISELKQLSEIENLIDKIDEMKSEIETYKNNSILVLNMIVNLERELKNRSFSKSEYEKSAERGKIVRMDLDKINQIIGEIRKSIEIFNQNKSKAENILKKKEKLEDELNPAKELAKLLEGRKFLDFLSAGKLQSITRKASDTLQKITNGRYRINVDEKSDFSIIDNFNSSVRKPQSLSGGETFMVSLCLALALADQIQLRGKSRLEFFFLDEGFGTLDSELLEIVFSVLENLKAEGMTVGIITHVEEIKNRVARKLIVTPAKVGEAGTIVREI